MNDELKQLIEDAAKRIKNMPSNAEVNGGRLADRPSEAV